MSRRKTNRPKPRSEIQASAPNPPARRRTRLILAGGFIAVAIGAYLTARPDSTPVDQLYLKARQALEDRRTDDALTLAEELIDRAGESPQALLLAGEASARSGRYDAALDYFARIPDDDGESAVAGLSQAGQLNAHLGRASEAERCFRQALVHAPTQTAALRRLAHILAVEGRRAEAEPFLFELLKQDEITIDELILLGNLAPTFDAPDEVKRWRAAVPSDSLPLLGLVRLDIRDGKHDAALGPLRSIVADQPAELEPQAWLGWVLAQQGNRAGLAEWNAALPPGADDHALIWAVRGRWADDEGDREGAIRCYGEAVRRDPNQEFSNYQLALLLSAEGLDAQAAHFHERIERLRALAATLRAIYPARDRLRTIPKAKEYVGDAARLTELLGRPWEALRWYTILLAIDRRLDLAIQERERLQKVVAGDPPRTLPAANPALAVDLASYPLPNWDARRPKVESPSGDQPRPRIAFADRAAEMGIDFRYHDGKDPAREGRYLRESLGGGVAVLDFDGDAWPDLYFTQGCDWPVDPADATHADRLFRNIQGRRFVDVTALAGLGDNRYSQGVAAGDFNNDGFPDLFLANIGGNRLYRNEGDGTFRDVTAEAAIANDDWTASCLIADINGDAWPDLFAVNYVEGPTVHTQLCDTGGRQRICGPYHFSPQRDRLYLSLGEGRFEDVTLAAGIPPGGNGLGIVAADFDESGRLSLFIANDESPNFYLVNQTPVRGDSPVFIDRGLVSGLALNKDGLAQGCMGIAADDFTGDSLLDLVVTNLDQESSTFYEQIEPGTAFADNTLRRGLKAATYTMVGFGAQSLDADLDGRPDLLLTNGHVDDYTFQGKKLYMRPQFFHNRGDGPLVEIFADELGSFFAGEYLGRGLARLDWNRDGLEDAAISHIGAPAALLTNETQDAGHFVAIQLRGTTSDRDAIGATLVIQLGGKTLTRQLTAGDGYFAANQRQIVVGLGRADRIDRLDVRWPSGIEQTFTEIAGDSQIVIVEGRANPFPH